MIKIFLGKLFEPVKERFVYFYEYDLLLCVVGAVFFLVFFGIANLFGRLLFNVFHAVEKEPGEATLNGMVAIMLIFLFCAFCQYLINGIRQLCKHVKNCWAESKQIGETQ